MYIANTKVPRRLCPMISRTMKPILRLYLFLVLCIVLWMISLKLFSHQPQNSEQQTISLEAIEPYANNYLKDVTYSAESFDISDNVGKKQHNHQEPFEQNGDTTESTNPTNLEKQNTMSENNDQFNHINRNEPQNTLEFNNPTQAKKYPKYYDDDNLRPTWAFQISKTYDEMLLRSWSEPIELINKSDKWTQSEYGKPFEPLNKKDEETMINLRNKHNYNIFASDRISLQRRLPDYRYPECKELEYPDRLPTVSIIIVIHNEAWSMVLRTVWSIINRSPRELIQEIILVDDASTWSSLKRPLDDYIELLPVNIRIIRTDRREGLIRARLIGARNATGSVLTFLDAHMECTKGWLEPILGRIANDRSVVVTPLIEPISSNDMSFKISPTVVVGLQWNLILYRMSIPQRELLRTNYDKTAPLRTPSHVGCAFAIDREFFFEIGSYDEKMDVWGSENVELAFRVWMCGGSLEILPCSRIGHLFRTSTYSFNGNQNEIKTRNNVRLVEVWMDEFKHLFYTAIPHSKNVSPGDVMERKELRKRLQCHSFRWYLENIYPESNWLKEYIFMGEIKNIPTNECLDTYKTALDEPLMNYKCHGDGNNQFFAFAKSGEILIISEWLCVGVNNNRVVLVKCTDEIPSQKWDYDSENKWIVHRQSNLCMQHNSTGIIIGTCDLQDSRFQWELKSTFSIS